jgi:GNAT superfamily N-acetyltransferase
MGTLRAFELTDAARCCEIIHACLPTMSGLNPAARQFVAAKTIPLALAHEVQQMFTLVCEHQGVVVGMRGLDRNEIKRMYVHLDAHGHGKGTAILHALEAEAKRRCLPSLRAQAAPTAVAFYAKWGYVSMNSECWQLGQAQFRVVNMTKVL